MSTLSDITAREAAEKKAKAKTKSKKETKTTEE